jgi:hypothetical protein
MGADVPEGKDLIILVELGRGDVTFNNLAKQAVVHGGNLGRKGGVSRYFPGKSAAARGHLTRQCENVQKPGENVNFYRPLKIFQKYSKCFGKLEKFLRGTAVEADVISCQKKYNGENVRKGAVVQIYRL